MATQAREESLSELEREAEHTRADLIHTVDQLHSRVSPQAIKEEAQAYARDTTNGLFRNLEQKARENPLAAVAVAAGLAYPALRILTGIPAPVLLVGAGLALNQLGGSTTAEHGVAARRGTRGRAVAPSADGLGPRVQEASANLSRTADGLKKQVSAAAEQVKSTVSSGLNTVPQAASAVTDAASRAVETATETASQTYRSAVDLASRAEHQVSATARESKDSFVGAIENHPLIAGGIGLAIGAIIASALPVTQVEDRAWGDASDELKNRAANMASEGAEIAKTAAGEAYQDAASRVQQQGLTPDTVRETVRSAGAELRNAAEQATDALGEQSPETSSPSVIPHT